jgi:hypothetical protein
MRTLRCFLACLALVMAWQGACCAPNLARAQGETALSLSGCAAGLERELSHLVEIENHSGALGASFTRALVQVKCQADAAVIEAVVEEHRLQRIIALDAEAAPARALSLAIVELLHDLRFEIDAARAARAGAEQTPKAEEDPPNAAHEITPTGRDGAAGAPEGSSRRAKPRSSGRLWLAIAVPAALNDARSVRWSPGLSLDFLARPWISAGIACQVSLPHAHTQQGITSRAFWSDATATLALLPWRSERAVLRVQAGFGLELLSARAGSALDFQRAGRVTRAATLTTLDAAVFVWLQPKFGFGVHAGAQAPSRSLDYGIVFEGRRVTFVDPWPVSPYLKLSLVLRGLR